MRIVDEAVLEEARNRNWCEWCGTTWPGTENGRMDPSHAIPVARRGEGGGDDTVWNVTSSCRKCHNSHHDGHEPTTYQLLQLAKFRELTRKPDGTHARVIGKNLGIPSKELESKGQS